jgi:hypothetical protein
MVERGVVEQRARELKTWALEPESGIVGGPEGVWIEEDPEHNVRQLMVVVEHVKRRTELPIKQICSDTPFQLVQFNPWPGNEQPTSSVVVGFLSRTMPTTFGRECGIAIRLKTCWVVFGGRSRELALIQVRPFRRERSNISHLVEAIAKLPYCLSIEFGDCWIDVKSGSTWQDIERAHLHFHQAG